MLITPLTCFTAEDLLGTGFLVYVFSTRVLSMVLLADFIGLYQGTFLAHFGCYLFRTNVD